MSKTKQAGNTRSLPFSLIEAAAGGNVGAINNVLNHYMGYILTLSTRKFFDEYGNVHYCVDDELRRTLETKLIVKILQFDMVRAA
jgi:hypothetical protein